MKTGFSARELDVMAVLWELGSATVAEVQTELHDDLAYTTVLTVLRTLEDKGHVSHEDAGRAHRYLPLVDRETAGTNALKRILSTVFGGSPQLLLTNLVNDQDLTRAQIREMRKLLNEMPGKREKA